MPILRLIHAFTVFTFGPSIQQHMNTFIRKYNSGLLTAGIYLFLVIFALVVTFGN